MQITLSLLWLTIRIDVIPNRRERAPITIETLSPDELKASHQGSLGPHLLKDIGGDDSSRD